jgi:competence protein ComEA
MSKTYYVFLVIVFLVSFSLGFFLRGFLFKESHGEKVLSLGDLNKEEKISNGEDCDLYVDVSGAVMNPGVVCLQEGAILNDAVVKADGFNPSAYAFKYVAQRVNLARRLEDEEKIYIPFRDDVVCKMVEDVQVKHTENVVKGIASSFDELGFEGEVVEKGKGQSEVDCISINNASKEKIMELKGIGEAKAGDIIEGRPYSKVEDLKNVKGIGEKTFENIKEQICL